MPTTPSVLVFDVNETLIDIESIAPLFAELFGQAEVLHEWFAQLVLYSMAVTLADRYVDFFTLGQGVLHMLADVYRVEVTDADVGRLQEQMRTMPAHPDALEALTSLRDNGFRLVTLTNSPHRSGVPTPLDNAGLADLFDQQLSVESCRAFKPSPTVYQHACEALGVVPTDCMMVAAHVWDLLGAQNVGFSTALITRPGNPPLPVQGLPQPTLVVGDLHQLAEELIAAS
ncbi:haloacid dehalogenase type II [Mycobacterium montefiorense]|uniref:Haloacid dehalogenase n=1 Tax=Mycobacterium montefiorense TaxID=154654 RepID=A0AA37PQC8_9MYCO|nr:haloacid dehalogenase type II [Mycobacterium montefiorense]GBG36287.1 haloacid dehalogenase [Mycobacterium montefiorense]GKU32944.1 haloacid dehalogenase [Mycobacterium montefiorense]GKU38586.1 haloacid dehalogenase [Mycobacterium montefiorense]GKU46647.1 haloacid dehalogenase [Mycobacterium montefiorense]GKU51580.1 haloacid dehalogenase [Mycobacterium montefiorense]